MKTCIICCVPAQILYWENLISEMAKMLSANEIAGFLNQLFFKLMKQSYFWHVDANS